MSVPRVFGLPHLTEDSVAAFADGVLSPSAAIRARRHCSECVECAEAVRGQREAAMLLRAAGSPLMPAGLLDRLTGLSMSAPLPPSRGGLPTALGADGVPVFVAYSPPSAKPSSCEARGDGRTELVAARPAHRRVLLPVSILASAAAVVAAGALGSSVTTFKPSVEAPASANFASNLVAKTIVSSASANSPGRQTQEDGSSLPDGPSLLDGSSLPDGPSLLDRSSLPDGPSLLEASQALTVHNAYLRSQNVYLRSSINRSPAGP